MTHSVKVSFADLSALHSSKTPGQRIASTMRVRAVQHNTIIIVGKKA